MCFVVEKINFFFSKTFFLWYPQLAKKNFFLFLTLVWSRYSLDCREGHMKKTKMSLRPCLCQGQRNKVKKTYLKLFYRKFFFFSKSLYLVETKVASAKNVWRGVRRVTPPQNHSKKYFCLPQSRVKWVEMTNVTCYLGSQQSW